MKHRNHYKCTHCDTTLQGVVDSQGHVVASDLPPNPEQTEPLPCVCDVCCRKGHRL